METHSNTATTKQWIQPFAHQKKVKEKNVTFITSCLNLWGFFIQWWSNALHHLMQQARTQNKVTCSYYLRDSQDQRQMQTLIPHEVIQVVSHWSFLPHLEYPHRYWGTCKTNSSKMSNEPNIFQVTWRKQNSTYTEKWCYFDELKLINSEQWFFPKKLSIFELCSSYLKFKLCMQ